jgi:hypothetical protein
VRAAQHATRRRHPSRRPRRRTPAIHPSVGAHAARLEELAAEGLIEGRPGSGMVIASRPPGAMSAFDPRRALRDAQYPSRTVAFEDPDGSALYLIY